MFIGWDACLDEAMLNKDDIERIRNCSDLGRFAIECNRQLIELNTERFGEPVLDMADPAAMAAVLYPECIKECDAYYCDVDISQGISYGAVLVDKYHFSGKEPNAEICSALHGDKFKDYLYRMLLQQRLRRRSEQIRWESGNILTSLRIYYFSSLAAYLPPIS